MFDVIKIQYRDSTSHVSFEILVQYKSRAVGMSLVLFVKFVASKHHLRTHQKARTLYLALKSCYPPPRRGRAQILELVFQDLGSTEQGVCPPFQGRRRGGVVSFPPTVMRKVLSDLVR